MNQPRLLKTPSFLSWSKLLLSKLPNFNGMAISRKQAQGCYNYHPAISTWSHGPIIQLQPFQAKWRQMPSRRGGRGGGGGRKKWFKVKQECHRSAAHSNFFLCHLQKVFIVQIKRILGFQIKKDNEYHFCPFDSCFFLTGFVQFWLGLLKIRSNR